MTSQAPNRVAIQTAVGAFLTAILPPGTPVIRGQDNRVPEPSILDFVVFTEIQRTRLSTNVDTYADVKFTGFVTGKTLTVTAVNFGSIVSGSTLFGVNVNSFTTISMGGTGTGGVGTYPVSQFQNVPSSQLSAGQEILTQSVRVMFQIDVHGPNSADNAMTISTLWRDDFGAQFFNANFYAITPLYADDPRQMPFLNDQEQIETRYLISAELEAIQAVFGSSTIR